MKRLTSPIIHLLCLIPIGYLLWDYSVNNLGTNPFQTLAITTGHSAMVFLLLTLAVTPLRTWGVKVCHALHLPWGAKAYQWGPLFIYRRRLGLYAFFYASLHLLIYLYFELNFDGQEFWYEFTTRWPIPVGVSAWLVMLSLALTSPLYIKKMMKAHWQRLHRAMYLLAVLAVTHHWLMVKPTEVWPEIYAMVVAVLLLARLKWIKDKR